MSCASTLRRVAIDDRLDACPGVLEAPGKDQKVGRANLRLVVLAAADPRRGWPRGTPGWRCRPSGRPRKASAAPRRTCRPSAARCGIRRSPPESCRPRGTRWRLSKCSRLACSESAHDASIRPLASASSRVRGIFIFYPRSEASARCASAASVDSSPRSIARFEAVPAVAGVAGLQVDHPQVVVVHRVFRVFLDAAPQRLDRQRRQVLLVVDPAERVVHVGIVGRRRLGALRQVQCHVEVAALFGVEEREVVGGHAGAPIERNDLLVIRARASADLARWSAATPPPSSAPGCCPAAWRPAPGTRRVLDRSCLASRRAARACCTRRRVSHRARSRAGTVPRPWRSRRRSRARAR